MITNSKKIFASVSLLFLNFLWQPLSVKGQGKLLEGYIISSKGDSVKGFVRYEGWDESPVYIGFRKDKNADEEKLFTTEVREVYFNEISTRFKSRKIGVLNIDLSQEYSSVPSLIPKDSLSFFLREVTTGAKATLMEFVNGYGESHYFLEKESGLTELINYPFYRRVGEQKYLLTLDQYRKQLPLLLSDSEDPGMPLPEYTEKGLRRYIQRYNEPAGNERPRTSPYESEVTFDFSVNGGIEGWKEPEIRLSNKFGYGFGFRVNLARRFNNRYFRFNFLAIPGVSVSELYGYVPDEKITLKTIEFGVGSHFGTSKIRPYLGLDYSFALDNWRSTVFGPHVGISFRKQVNLEISHFGNFYTVFTEIPFFNKPRISLHYYLNLNKLFGN